MSRSETINIVGNGLAGSIVARVLRQQGYRTRVFGDQDPYSASMASSNLYIASWLKKFSSEGRRGLEVLESLQLEKEQPFDRGIAEAAKVWHIPQRNILLAPDVSEKVVSTSANGVFVAGEGGGSGDRFFPGKTVLCCGHRGAELAPYLADKLSVLVGHCFLLEGELPEGKSLLGIVSPYTHEKLYQYAPNLIYYADSVAVKLSSWEKRKFELRERSWTRLEKALGMKGLRETGGLVEYRVGYRPIVSGHPFGICKQLKPNLWVINGGGKNGMVAYANAAAQLVEQL